MVSLANAKKMKKEHDANVAKDKNRKAHPKKKEENKNEEEKKEEVKAAPAGRKSKKPLCRNCNK